MYNLKHYIGEEVQKKNEGCLEYEVVLNVLVYCSMPKQLIMKLVDSVVGTEKGNIKECLLCQRILQELLPLGSEYESQTGKMMEKIPSTLHLQIFKVRF